MRGRQLGGDADHRACVLSRGRDPRHRHHPGDLVMTNDIADKIYAATGLTLNAEAAAKIGQMIQQARRDALEEAVSRVKAYAQNETARNILTIIYALGEKE